MGPFDWPLEFTTVQFPDGISLAPPRNKAMAIWQAAIPTLRRRPEVTRAFLADMRRFDTPCWLLALDSSLEAPLKDDGAEECSLLKLLERQRQRRYSVLAMGKSTPSGEFFQLIDELDEAMCNAEPQAIRSRGGLPIVYVEARRILPLLREANIGMFYHGKDHLGEPFRRTVLEPTESLVITEYRDRDGFVTEFRFDTKEHGVWRLNGEQAWRLSWELGAFPLGERDLGAQIRDELSDLLDRPEKLAGGLGSLLIWYGIIDIGHEDDNEELT